MSNKNSENNENSQPSTNILLTRFNTRHGFVTLKIDDIVYCEASGNYTVLYFTKDHNELISRKLKQIETVLPNTFFRLGRSYVVNLNYLYKVNRKTKTCELLKDGEKFKLTVSKAAIRELDTLFKG